MRQLNISLTEPQSRFALSNATYPAIVAGFGSGKTEALINRLLIRKVSFPKGLVGYYAPSYDLVSKIFYPRMEELLTNHNIPYKLNKQEKLINTSGYGSFIARTMDKPSSIVGYEHADAGIDELDTLNKEHARDAWRKIIARNRLKKPLYCGINTVAVATTPEGFRFVYEKWKKDIKPGYELIHASTYSNSHNLPSDYISNLENDYPAQLLLAYLEGQFCNLTSGAVYPEFDRVLNGTNEKIKDGEALHIGMDFNVLKMAAVVFVVRDGYPYALDEFTSVRDTPTMCELIKSKYKNRGRSITIYPDASGHNTTSKAFGVSDHTQLQGAGFYVSTGTVNPLIRDRVAAVNAIINNSKRERALRVNTEKCVEFARSLEQQAYDKNGMPDKDSGLDHCADAGGYFIANQYSLVSSLQRVVVKGIQSSR